MTRPSTFLSKPSNRKNLVVMNSSDSQVNPPIFFLHRDDCQQLIGLWNRGLGTWNLETGQLLRHQLIPDIFAKAKDFKITDDTPVFFQTLDKRAAEDKSVPVRVWDIRISQQISLFQGHVLPNDGYVISPDRSKIAGCDYPPKSVSVWDAQTGEKRYEFPWSGGFFGQNLWLCFTPDGQKLFCGNGLSYKATCMIKGWDLNTGEECFQTIPTEKRGFMISSGANEGAKNYEGVCALKINRDGRLLVAALYEGVIKIWSTHSGELLWEYPLPLSYLGGAEHLDKGLVIGIAPNDEVLFCQCSEYQDSMWFMLELETGKVLQKGQSSEGRVFHFAFSEDSKTVVTSSPCDHKSVMKIWNWQSSPAPQPLILKSRQFPVRRV